MCDELLSFSKNFHAIVSDDSSEESQCTNGSCNKCLSCALLLLHRLNLHCCSYSNLYVVDKVILTLPCTQVKCELVFSKLKIIKTRLRSMLAQDN